MARRGVSKPVVLEQVTQRELREINRRREAAHLPLLPTNTAHLLACRLNGLAISGGGVRSAAFSLGVVQALAEEPKGSNDDAGTGPDTQKRNSVFRNIDYLSTVSGGGYTGALLSAWLAKPTPSLEAKTAPGRTEKAVPWEALLKRPGQPESSLLVHLRDGSRYLSSGSLTDQFKLPMVLLRGFLLNLLALMPAILLSVSLLEFVYEQESLGRGIVWAETAPPWLWASLALLPFSVSVVTYPPLSLLLGSQLRWKARDLWEKVLGGSLLFSVAFLALVLLFRLVDSALDTSWLFVKEAFAHNPYFSYAHGTVLAAAAAVAQGALHSIREAKSFVSKILLYGFALLIPCIPVALFILLCIMQVDLPFVSADFSPVMERLSLSDESAYWSDSQSGAETCATSRAQLARRMDTALAQPTEVPIDELCMEFHRELWGKGLSPHPKDENIIRRCHQLTQPIRLPDTCDERARGVPPSTCSEDRATSKLGESPLFFRKDRDRSGRPPRWFASTCPSALFSSKTALLPVESPRLEREGIVLFDLKFPRGSRKYFLVKGGHLRFGGEKGKASLLSDQTFLGIGIALFFFVLFFYSANRSSLHSFYRDRLSRLFIMRPQAGGGLVHADQLKLSELSSNGEGSFAPYHLINATLNLQANQVKARRGRPAAFFVFSKLYCGSTESGYFRTRAFEWHDHHLDLATAMAVSGAAASPNTGAVKIGPLSAALTLLNLRLNYWLVNPAAFKRKKCLSLWSHTPGIKYLLREATGNLDYREPDWLYRLSLGRFGRLRPTRYLNLSDGGHVENLGIYELLRRNCSVIVAIDGEADPKLEFGGLANLIRLASIDLSIDIDIDVSSIRDLNENAQREHVAFGTIHYCDQHKGTLVYIKASLCGCEPLEIQQFAQQPAHTDFPHETTANQSFDESQFEAYRALGQHIGSHYRNQILALTDLSAAAAKERQP